MIITRSMACARKKNRRDEAEEEQKGEDRISGLPDELIHLIFTFMGETKFAVRTCILSTRWKNIWKSLPHLNFDCEGLNDGESRKFFKQVSRVFFRRNHTCQISTINLNSRRWVIEPSLFKRILGYTFSHGIENLEIRDGYLHFKQFLIPTAIVNSQSLKHLKLSLPSDSRLQIFHSPQSVGNLSRAQWNLPNLTTLYLHYVQLGFSCHSCDKGHTSADFFSNLVNLKDLSLIYCYIYCDSSLAALNIISLSLESLTIATHFDDYTCMNVVSTPNLTSLRYSGGFPLFLSATERLNCLTEATIEIPKGSMEEHETVDRIYGVLILVRNVGFLTISYEMVEMISGVTELLENRASPLSNLKCLTIKGSKSTAISNDFITYFLNSSPNASVETTS